jgi:hypothetical protein
MAIGVTYDKRAVSEEMAAVFTSAFDAGMKSISESIRDFSISELAGNLNVSVENSLNLK